MPDGFVRVVFELEVDEDGWPPGGAERLWAVPLSADTARLANIPFFVWGVAWEDVVRFVDQDGILLVTDVVGRSGNSTIRIVLSQGDGSLEEAKQAVLDDFSPYGVDGAVYGHYNLVTLSVPSNADVAAVKRLVRDGEQSCRWYVEEACTTEAWRSV